MVQSSPGGVSNQTTNVAVVGCGSRLKGNQLVHNSEVADGSAVEILEETYRTIHSVGQVHFVDGVAKTVEGSCKSNVDRSGGD